MTISELVKRLLDAGANAEVVAIAIAAIEEERAEREEAQPARRRRSKARKPEIVAQRA
jgi:hypothetical protein